MKVLVTGAGGELENASVGGPHVAPAYAHTAF